MANFWSDFICRNRSKVRLETGAAAFNYLVSPLTVGMQVWANWRIATTPQSRAAVLDLLMGESNCVSICEVAGEWNFLAWVVAQTPAELNAFSDRLNRHCISVSARTVQRVHKNNCDYARIID